MLCEAYTRMSLNTFTMLTTDSQKDSKLHAWEGLFLLPETLLSFLPEASSGNSSTLTDHHPDAETLEQCHSKLLLNALPPELAQAGRETELAFCSLQGVAEHRPGLPVHWCGLLRPPEPLTEYV